MPPHREKCTNHRTVARNQRANGLDRLRGREHNQLRKLGIKFARIQHIFISQFARGSLLWLNWPHQHLSFAGANCRLARLRSQRHQRNHYAPIEIGQVLDRLQFVLPRVGGRNCYPHPRPRKVYGGNPSTRSSGIYQRLPFPRKSGEAKNKLGRSGQLWGRYSRYGKPQTRERHSVAQWRLGRKPIAHF